MPIEVLRYDLIRMSVVVSGGTRKSLSGWFDPSRDHRKLPVQRRFSPKPTALAIPKLTQGDTSSFGIGKV
jgi:hypothetical protein